MNKIIYAVVIYEYDTYSYGGTSPVIQEPLYVDKESALRRCEELQGFYKRDVSSVTVEEYKLSE